ncbi:hypothetical protein K2173_009662 [Erythroxylum novogranatense]|uniref:Uncharacterized protein n=1 Tax=Erythroxylum novogranatense TaxID=1862640 RepID=A0AAV8U4L5_9ROSI|nr:hypothetical protein K2173_009662 [Erythroxylum novogranatense]
MVVCMSILHPHTHLSRRLPNPNLTFPLKLSDRRNLSVCSQSGKTSDDDHLAWIRVTLTASSIFFLGLNVGLCRATPTPLLRPTETRINLEEQNTDQVDNGERNPETVKSFESEELNAAFETWKSKTYALSVPLNVITLRGSVPPSWFKDFMQSQGKRLRFRNTFVGSLEKIFDELSVCFNRKKIGPKSAVAADVLTLGDSWLSFAIKNSLIEPIRGIEDQDWYKGLSYKWKAYLRRNYEGEIDPKGEVWAAPYRWGSMVIAYKKSKFQKNKLAPIEDWADLWWPELTGKISMVDSPREVVGAVLKYMGASYNTNNISLQVAGGRNAVQENLASFSKQVRLFDSSYYLKAFAVGDVWVAVGWSSDVLPVAKRMSNVAVIVPKSGTSIWADLWAIPAASRLEPNLLGGRVRGASPLIHQWFEFCLQTARALPFKQEVIPGATPSALEGPSPEISKDISQGKPKLDTNLIAGVPPPEILSKCEFLEPLPDDALSDYEWLISSMQISASRIHLHTLATTQKFWASVRP